tara:strand:- start:10284 stop:10544 length:261 start_codon:yes stop_codon:yes gene_type:complete
MDFSRYDKFIAKSSKNVIKNKNIVEGGTIKYFNVEGDVLIEKVDYRLGIVIFERKYIYNGGKNQYNYKWYDYFMDANCFVLEEVSK